MSLESRLRKLEAKAPAPSLTILSAPPSWEEAEERYRRWDAMTREERRAELLAEIEDIKRRVEVGMTYYSLLGTYKRRRDGQVVCLHEPAWEALLPGEGGTDGAVSRGIDGTP